MSDFAGSAIDHMGIGVSDISQAPFGQKQPIPDLSISNGSALVRNEINGT